MKPPPREVSFRELWPDKKTSEEYFEYGLDEFFRFEQFGVVVDLNGVKLKAQLFERTGDRGRPDIAHKQKEFYIHPALHGIVLVGEFVVVCFKTADYLCEKERVPKNTETVRLNGKRYAVMSSMSEYGITRLELEADRQNTPLPSAARMGLAGLYE